MKLMAVILLTFVGLSFAHADDDQACLNMKGLGAQSECYKQKAGVEKSDIHNSSFIGMNMSKKLISEAEVDAALIALENGTLVDELTDAEAEAVAQKIVSEQLRNNPEKTRRLIECTRGAGAYKNDGLSRGCVAKALGN